MSIGLRPHGRGAAPEALLISIHLVSVRWRRAWNPKGHNSLLRNMYVGCMCMRYLYPVDGIQGNAQILWMTSMVYLDPMDVMEGIYIDCLQWDTRIP